MIAAQHIQNKVADISPAQVFTIADLGFPSEWWENVRVKLGRMVKSGLIERAGKGRYYKPKTSVFGKIGPDRNEVVKDLLYTNGILTGYLTGYSVWNLMGLTTQVSSMVIIGSSHRHDPVKRGHYQVRFIMQANKITPANIPLLQILDALKLIKHIPDTTIDRSITVLRTHIILLGERQLSMLVKLSMKYPPRVRALLGAILHADNNNKHLAVLKNSLNPTTVYSLGINPSTDIDFNGWNIK